MNKYDKLNKQIEDELKIAWNGIAATFENNEVFKLTFERNYLKSALIKERS